MIQILALDAPEGKMLCSIHHNYTMGFYGKLHSDMGKQNRKDSDCANGDKSMLVGS